MLTNESDRFYTSASGSKAVPTDLLTGLFFTLDGVDEADIDYSSAIAEQVIEDGNPTVDNVPVRVQDVVGGWQLKPATGFGTAGFGIFDGNLTGGQGNQQFNYGIINDEFDYLDPDLDTNLSGKGPLVRDMITFTLTMPAGSLSEGLTEIGEVVFQYGTALSEPNFPGERDDDGGITQGEIPEPSTVAIWSLLGLVGLGYGWRKRRSA